VTEIILLLKERGISEQAATNIQSLGEELRAYTIEHGTEFAALAEVESGIQVGEVLGGSASAIDIAPHLNAMKTDRQYVHIHTHPSSSAFSDTDARTFVFNSQIKVMTVVGNDGTWYILSKRVDFVPVIPQHIVDVYRHEVNALIPRYLPLVQRGEMPEQAAWREHIHEAWQSIAQRLRLLLYDRVEPQRGG